MNASLTSLMLLNALRSNPQSPIPNQNPSPDLSLIVLALLLAGRGGGGKKSKGPADPEKRRQRGMTLEQFTAEEYLPGKNHLATGATAEIAGETLQKVRACFHRSICVKEITGGLIDRFRNWLAAQVQGKKFSPATGNKHLRQLRAIYSYAARRRLIRLPPPIDFLEEVEADVTAWTPDELARIEAAARALPGTLPPCKLKPMGVIGPMGPITPIPACVFWTAWILVLQKLGCRITAMMLCRRDDYDPDARTLLLRRENQKQRRAQRIALPPRAAEAVERLLASHGLPRIFGCWPFDPPLPGGRRHWKVLAQHFDRLLVIPAGLTLAKGVKTRQFRRSAATIVEEYGGNAQELLGHASRKTTERYLSRDPKRRKICRQSLCIPDGAPAQRVLF